MLQHTRRPAPPISAPATLPRATRWCARLGTCGLVALAGWLAGCADVAKQGPALAANAAPAVTALSSTEPLFQDGLFAPATEAVDAQDLFAVTPEMVQFLRGELAVLLRTEGRQRGLYMALQSQKFLKLAYDSAQTRTAAEAFRDRAGNCLSLVVLSAALGRQLDLQVSFREVLGEDSWGLSDDLVVASGHVNVVFGQRNWTAFGDDSQSYVVDFMPSEAVKGQRSRPINDEVVIAMFQNNRAVERLTQGRLDDAYWWARAAALRQPQRVAPLNTLGVIYQRRGLPVLAEQTYRRALAMEPKNVRTLSNLAGLMRADGRAAEAAPLDAQILALMPNPPFHHFRLGLAAAQQRDWPRARDELSREVARDPGFQDAQAWLAQAYLELGDLPQARAHLAAAAKSGNTPGSRALYAAKLERLRAASAQMASRH